MKYISLFLIFTITIVASSCATPKFRSFKSHDEFGSTVDKLTGKNPKEVVAILGKPMRAFFNDGIEDKYSIVYPVGKGEISLTEIMFNTDLVCYSMTFEKENNYKFQGWRTTAPDSSCRNTKDEKMNTSLID